MYPGFLQHAGFIAMNPVRHASAHLDFYDDVARGEHVDAEEHRRFYDEYNAVLDMPAEYYLDCIRVVFQQHLLPRGLWHVGGERVAPEAITDTALMTVEGEKDDISGLGQTRAAHALTTGIPAHRKEHLTVAGAGHYGIFSGRRWRDIVYPRLREFLAAAEREPAQRIVAAGSRLARATRGFAARSERRGRGTLSGSRTRSRRERGRRRGRSADRGPRP